MPYLLADFTWRPALSRVDPWAWCLVAVHLWTCWCCLAAARRRKTSSLSREDARASRFWHLLAGVTFCLGLNTLFDLQTLLTMWARDAAIAEGWYADRRTYQSMIVKACAAAGLVGFLAGLYVLRRQWRECGLAYLGIVFLLTLVVIRAVSLHYVDRVLFRLPGVGPAMNYGLELSGSLLVSLAALRASWRTTPPPAPAS